MNVPNLHSEEREYTIYRREVHAHRQSRLKAAEVAGLLPHCLEDRYVKRIDVTAPGLGFASVPAFSLPKAVAGSRQ